jgi:plastocyanin
MPQFPLPRAIALTGALLFASVLFSAAADAQTPPPSSYTVGVHDAAFTPSTLTINVGATVTFVYDAGINQAIAHLPADDTCFYSYPRGALFGGTATFAATFTHAGTYRYVSLRNQGSGAENCGYPLVGYITVVEPPVTTPPLPTGSFPAGAPQHGVEVTPVTYPSYQPYQYVPIPGDFRPRMAATGDVNGDGIADVVAAWIEFGPDNRPSQLFTAFGRPHAKPRLGDPWSTPQRFDTLALGDFDGDHYADLILSTPTDVHYARGMGDGTFTAPQVIFSGLAAPNPQDNFRTERHASIADLDGDGHLDLLLPDIGRIVVLYGQGDGTFRPAATFSPTAPGDPLGAQEFVDAEAADVNGDGHPDLVGYELNTFGANRVYVYLHSSGGLTLAQTITNGDAIGYEIEAGDIDADGYTDIAASNAVGLISIFYGSPGGLSRPIAAGLGSSLLGNTRMIVADVDNDGHADIVVDTAPDGDYAAYFNGLNPLATGTTIGTRSRFGSGTRAADLNGDGLLDFVSPSTTGGGLVVVLSGQADTTAPVITAPGDFVAEALSAVTFTVTAHDDVFGDVPVTCTTASPYTVALGPTAITCTAIDGADNEASATFTITGVDTTAPVLTVPGDFTVAYGAIVTFTATAVDQISGPRPVACAPASGFAATTTTTVSCSASDAADNGTTKTFTVSVTPPTVADLIAKVKALSLQQGIENSLLTKIKAGALGAFQNEVRAQAGKKISAADAAALIAFAQLVAP